MFVHILKDVCFDPAVEFKDFDPRKYIRDIPEDIKKKFYIYVVPDSQSASPASPASPANMEMQQDDDDARSGDTRSPSSFLGEEAGTRSPNSEEGQPRESDRYQGCDMMLEEDSGDRQQWQDVPLFDDEEPEIDFKELGDLLKKRFGELTSICYDQWERYMDTISDPQCQPQCQNLKKYQILSTYVEKAWVSISRINDCHVSCQFEKYKELHDDLIREIIQGMLEIDRKGFQPLKYPYEIGPDFHLKDPYINVGALMFVASTLWMKKQEINPEPSRNKAPIDCTNEIQLWYLFYRVMCNVDIKNSFVHVTFVKLWKSAMKKPKKQGYYCTHDIAIRSFLGILQESVSCKRNVTEKSVLVKYTKKLESLVLLNAKDQDLVQGSAMDLPLSYPPVGNENSKGPIHKALFVYWNAEFDYQFEDMLYKTTRRNILDEY